MTARLELAAGRVLLAGLFLAGAVQKVMQPDTASALLAGFGLPEWLVWPAMLFNAGAAFLLIANMCLRPVSRALAFYCLVTSAFHFVPSDPWQMSIMVKNWALAGGLLVLSASTMDRGREETRLAPKR
ncbi:DoxX protein [Rhodobacteraceae bacterium AsT-22]|nr:DoxX protein [Rhodobacteraceae bacterium AsT-22]